MEKYSLGVVERIDKMELLKKNIGITLIALVVTLINSYD